MTDSAKNDDTNIPQDQTREQIAALACTLEGAYLIEASAGTGKTWTLTGIILRLLIEKKYPPERIIATTFTRAAAAEMQERISQRLHSFYGLMRHLQAMMAIRPEWFGDELPLDVISEHAKAAGYDAEDPINAHLLKVVLSQGAVFLNETVYRTGVLLTSMDKLFVGTLDSLAQKWLKEFAAQIGHQSGMEMLNDATDKIRALVHDGLRSEQVFLKNTHPKFYQIFTQNHQNFFSDVDAMANVVKTAINFFTAPIDPLPEHGGLAAITAIDDRIEALIKKDFSGFAPYYDDQYRADIKISANNAFAKRLHILPQILALMAEHGLMFISHLNSEQEKFFQEIQKTASKDWQIFNKSAQQTDVDKFNNLPLENLLDLSQISDEINALMAQYQAAISEKLIIAIKHKIAQELESQGQTTFVLQMVRLNEALREQPQLARHIRHHYPVALIDESQDVNGLQAEMMRLIYLDNLIEYRKNLHRYQQIGGDKPKSHKGFLLLVGDPKQAIYRFRGGDVSNYNFIKHYGQDADIGDAPLIDQSLTLTVNRRSSAPLIDALNVWFVDNGERGVANHADLGDGIFYQKIEATKPDGAITWLDAPADIYGQHPVTVLHFNSAPKDQMRKLQAHQLAGHINGLLQSDHTIHGRKIMPGDIAVLARNNNALILVQQALSELGITSVNPKNTNIFTTDAADDLLALLTAVICSHRQEHLVRFLTSGLVGMSLATVTRLLKLEEVALPEDSDDGFQTHILTYLKKIHEKWQKQGLSSALAWAMQHAANIHSDTADRSSLWLTAAKNGERYLLDLQRLIELVSEQSDLHELRLIDWYEKQGQLPADEHNKRPALLKDAAVNLLTIHKSKGLEFPIVYVIGLDDGVNRESGLTILPYSDDDYSRRLSLSRDRAPGDGYFKNLNHLEMVDEIRRLGYVALTRASEQLYVVVGDLSRRIGGDLPVYQWFDSTNETEISLPDRLSDHVSWVSLNDADLLRNNYQYQNDQPKKKTHADWDSLMPKTRFFGEYKTSFTNLVTRLDKAAIASVDDADVDQLAVFSNPVMPGDGSKDFLGGETSIASTFIKGSKAGEFLHKVLQYLPTEKMQGASKMQIDTLISTVVMDQGRKLGLPAEYLPPVGQAEHRTAILLSDQQDPDNQHTDLVAWLHQMISAPFLESQTSLIELPLNAQVRELSFTLGLGERFGIDALNTVFAMHSDKSLMLLDEDYRAVSYRYLRGEIDLVYEADGKFFVVDYKSNYLGDHPGDYVDDIMNMAMDKAGYWLQAALYQVALHRLLKIRLKDYQGNEMKYLGGVEYVFLRGLQADDQRTGHLFWQPPLDLIMALDDIL